MESVTPLDAQREPAVPDDRYYWSAAENFQRRFDTPLAAEAVCLKKKTMLLGNAMLVKKDCDMVKRIVILWKRLWYCERDFIRLSSYADVLWQS